MSLRHHVPRDELDLLARLPGSRLCEVRCAGYNAGWATGGFVEQAALTFNNGDQLELRFEPVLFGTHVPTDCRIAVRRGPITREPEPDDVNLARQIEQVLNLSSPFVIAEIHVYEHIGGSADRAYILGVGEYQGEGGGDKICNVLARDGRALHLCADSADSPEMTIDGTLPVLDKGTFRLQKIIR